MAAGDARRGLSRSVFAFVPAVVLLGVSAVVVGLHDAALDPAKLGVTAGGVLLLAYGVVQLVAAIELAALSRSGRWPPEGRPPCSRLVLVAFILTILLGLYVFLSAIRTVSEQWPIVVLAALGMIALGIGGLGFFGREAKVTLARVGAVALGLIGTTIGAWQFWYQHEYVPAHAGRAVTLTAELERLREGRTDDVIRATVEYESVGKSSVFVVGSSYTLTGSRLVRCRRRPDAARVEDVFNRFAVDPQRSRFMSDVWEIQPAAVLAAGKFVGDAKRLDSAVSGTRTYIFVVPRGRHELLRLRAQLFAIPTSVEISRTLPEYFTYPDDNNLYAFWQVEDRSWLRSLVYGRSRWVVLRYQLVREPAVRATSPDLRVTARVTKPTWTKRTPSREQVTGLFSRSLPSDSSEPFAAAELALGEAAAPTPEDRLPSSCEA